MTRYIHFPEYTRNQFPVRIVTASEHQLKSGAAATEPLEVLGKVKTVNEEQMFAIKALSLDTFWAGLLRARALHGIPYKLHETRSRSGSIGKNYRGWIAIAAKQVPYIPEDVLLRVTNLAASEYGEQARRFLMDQALYQPGHILALGQVKTSWLMNSQRIANIGKMELATGNWEPGNWAFELNPVIALPEPIPYKSKSQGGHSVPSEIYWQLTKVIDSYLRRGEVA